MTERPIGRRERYRLQTRDEVKRIALRQIAEAGLDALSLNAVARELGMTGPALYRYFAGRDELLAELVTDAYDGLADAVQAVAAAEVSAGAHGAADRCVGAGGAAADSMHAHAAAGGAIDAGVHADGEAAARDRLRALAAAYRAWALAQPHRYLLLFGAPVGSGTLAPERTIPAAHRTMAALLDAFAALVSTATDDGRHSGALDDQLAAWVRRRDGPDVAGRVARLGVTCWTRLHGVVSLEIAGHFATMGFDAALLYAAEVEALLAEAG